MMYQKSCLSLMGFSGKEPEQKFTKNGAVYTVLSLVTETSWQSDNEEWESRTECQTNHHLVEARRIALTLTKTLTFR